MISRIYTGLDQKQAVALLALAVKEYGTDGVLSISDKWKDQMPVVFTINSEASENGVEIRITEGEPNEN